MGGISSALNSSANALGVFSQAFDTIEDNISNANTPGYARQDVSLQAMPFDPASGLAGGVEAGTLLNSRSEYLDQAVRTQQQLLGSAQQRAGDLSQIEPLFDLTSGSGVAGAMNTFFNSFSQLSVNPNDQAGRQAVIAAAGQLARNIQQSAAGITQVAVNAASQTTTVVKQINQIAAQIAGINQRYQADVQAQQDEGLD
ncbi:MAG: FlgK family flagellar hook-associated protein, partial [Bryobacteraceae bacterium]